MICCLDLEGVLIPEIWIRVAQATRVPELRLTTRDIPDYDALMRRRLEILRKEGIRLVHIQRVIRKMRPLGGARTFLKNLRRQRQVIILSDTYYEFAGPMLAQLDFPVLFCNWLTVDRRGFISGYHLRQKNGKEEAIRALRGIGFKVKAVGDSYNDLTMLKAAHQGILFNPPPQIAKKYSRFPVTRTYGGLLRALLASC